VKELLLKYASGQTGACDYKDFSVQKKCVFVQKKNLEIWKASWEAWKYECVQIFF